MPIQEPTKSEDQTEGQEDGDEDEQEFIHEFQELGYSMDENEISTWLNSGSNDPAFQLMTDDEICDHVLSEQVPDQEDEPEPEHQEILGSSTKATLSVDQVSKSSYKSKKPPKPLLQDNSLPSRA